METSQRCGLGSGARSVLVMQQCSGFAPVSHAKQTQASIPRGYHLSAFADGCEVIRTPTACEFTRKRSTAVHRAPE